MFEEIDVHQFNDFLIRDGRRCINDLKHKKSKWLYKNVNLDENGLSGIDIDISEYVMRKYPEYGFKCILIIDKDMHYHQTLIYLNYNIFECSLNSKRGYHELDKSSFQYLLNEMMKDIYEDDFSEWKLYLVEDFPTEGVGLEDYLSYVMENNDEIILE